jgi:predicted Rossmann-fold nucleotide-binding protein
MIGNIEDVMMHVTGESWMAKDTGSRPRPSLGEVSEHSIDERFVRHEYRSMVIVSSSPDALLERFDQYVPPVVPKWIDAAAT